MQQTDIRTNSGKKDHNTTAKEVGALELRYLERIRFNPARIQLRRSSWHIRWA